MKFCPSCGTQNQDVANFCARCGTTLPAAVHGSPEYPEDQPRPRPEGQPGHAPPPPGYAPHAPQGGAYTPAGGYPQQYGAGYTPQGYGPPPPDMRGLDSGEQIGVFLGSLCVSPIVAVVLYFVWKDDKPQKAKEVCTLGWWVVGAWVAMYVLFFLFAILAGAAG